MLKILWARLQQGHRTGKFPDEEPALSPHFRGRPVLDPSRCADGCRACIDACPTQAIGNDAGLVLDMGRCLFCTDCVSACPEGAIRYTADYKLAARSRRELLVTAKDAATERALELGTKLRRLFGRSLKLRQVSAGGCNGCESDINVLGTVVFDLGRFGIQFVASPRHADGLLITGPVTRNMRLALKKTYDAIPDPKIVVAVGACAIAGGPYVGHPEASDGADGVVPVDLYVPGCPPHPYTILEGLLGLIGRLPRSAEPVDAIAQRSERAEAELKALGVDLARDSRSSKPVSGS
jgi:Ni,Fe-hydrogenase III small subunit/NAD-dependent dihydropyrimidine dehydrogenase PreA subunit